MSLKGQTVRIIVNKPCDRNENLFGTIVSDRGGNRLLVKLTKPLTGTSVSSDLIELRPISQNSTFNSLSQYFSIAVDGGLVTENSKDFDYIINGTVTLD